MESHLTSQFQYSDQDLFVPTEDLIDKYCPNLTKIYEERPEYKVDQLHQTVIAMAFRM